MADPSRERDDELIEVLWKTEKILESQPRNRQSYEAEWADTDSDASDNSSTVFDVHQKLHLQRPRNVSVPRERRRLVEYSKHVEASSANLRDGHCEPDQVTLQETSPQLASFESRLEGRMDFLEKRLKREVRRNKQMHSRMEEAENCMQLMSNQIAHIMACCDTPNTSTLDIQKMDNTKSQQQHNLQQSRVQMENFGDADYTSGFGC